MYFSFMFCRTVCRAARIFNIPWHAGEARELALKSHNMVATKEREGALFVAGRSCRDEKPLRSGLNSWCKRADEPVGRRFCSLPSSEFASELPADPITRLFFQAKGTQALYQGTYEDPTTRDLDPRPPRPTQRQHPRPEAPVLQHPPPRLRLLFPHR